jgi:enoyl-CoA hydratase/carnithine racemase
MEFVKISVTDGVADVKLNRPDKMNAMNDDMFDAIAEAGKTLAADKSIRVVVVSGEGRAFCAGLDMSNFARMAKAEGTKPFFPISARTHGIGNLGQHVALLWRDLPVPVIAAIHGVAFGAGLQIALGADIRYVTADAKLAFLEVKWGLIPDMGAFGLLRELMRADVARELVYSSRMVSGEEAVAIGLATRVEADPYAAAMATAKTLAGLSPDAISTAKTVFNISEDTDFASLAMIESVRQDMIIGTPNQVEAVQAGMEKRRPQFSARIR